MEVRRYLKPLTEAVPLEKGRGVLVYIGGGEAFGYILMCSIIEIHCCDVHVRGIFSRVRDGLRWSIRGGGRCVQGVEIGGRQ